ncbi:hypothetical protein D9757_000781 [Collybiopsis confluens]|uniref:Bola-like protein n=1 Tax=Collybiopsis confluens TaxID=2823264 RepID=A0A8H5I1S7_9AGAR|nr:hypothetical protein D9757_000781 [Collybiopsis confluens]
MFRLHPVFKRFSVMATTSQSSAGPIESAIRSKLTLSLQPTALIIHNDSHLHRHHAPMRAQGGGGGETHFSLQIVSDEFNRKTTMQRHRMVYSLLSEEFDQGLHSVSLKTSTTAEAETAKEAT